MNKIITLLLTYLLLQINVSLANEEQNLENQRQLTISEIEKYCSHSDYKFINHHGTKCVSHYFIEEGKYICTEDMYHFINKLRQIAIDDDAEAFADLLDYQLLFIDQDGSKTEISSRRDFIENYYKKFMNKYTRELLSSATLLDANLVYSNGTINVAFPLMNLATPFYVYGIRISSVKVFNKADYEFVLYKRKVKMKMLTSDRLKN